MKRIKSKSMFVIFLLLLSAVGLYGQTSNIANEWKNFKKKYGKQCRVSWNKHTGGVKKISGSALDLGTGINSKNIIQRLEALIKSNDTLLFLDNSEARLVELNESNNKFYLKYQQYYNDVPVWNATLRIIVLQNGLVSSINSDFIHFVNESNEPKIT